MSSNAFDKIHDANFRSYCTQFDINLDNYLSGAECRFVTTINVDDHDIASLQGVEQFANLRELHCENNTIEVLDLSKNASLEKLHCGGNQLQELDISANTALNTLVCGQQNGTLKLLLSEEQWEVWVATWADANVDVSLGVVGTDADVPNTAARGFFIYLAMDNNLSSFADVNIDELACATKADLNGGVIFALRDVPSAKSQLIAIFWDEANKTIRRKVVKTYDKNLNTSNPAVFAQVWSHVQGMIKADSWVISLGSHANGWFPAELYTRHPHFSDDDPGNALLRGYAPSAGVAAAPGARSLLQDNHGSIMNIDQLAEVLPKVDMLILDLCDMGGIESIYALRDKAKYIVASPAEVVNKGMPYDRIVDDIFNPDTRSGAIGICDAFYDLYLNYSDKDLQFGTLAVYDSSQIAGFVEVMRQVMGLWKDALPTMNTADIQSFDRPISGKHLVFDMRETIYALMGEDTNGAVLKKEFDSALSALVPYYKTTGKELVIRYLSGGVYSTKDIPADRFCGLGTYIPLATYTAVNPYYYQTAWAKAVF